MAFCPMCGNKFEHEVRFCPACGYNTAGAVPRRPQQAPAPASGAAASPPQMAPAPVGYAPPAVPTARGPRPAAKNQQLSIIAAATALVAGIVIFISTFLNWAAVWSGWNFFTEGGIDFVVSGDGNFIFTGFFSILMAVLIIASSIVIIPNARLGGVMTLVTSLVAFLMALSNVINIFIIDGKSDVSSTPPGVGLWFYLAMAVIAVIAGIVACANSQ